MTTAKLKISEFAPEHFADVIKLGNLVHGDGYLDEQAVAKIYDISFANGINASFVAYDGDIMVGFRLTYAAGTWPIDQWCTPEKWGHNEQNVCYFKCNTVAEEYRGQGVGSKLLKKSIEQAKRQGCTAGLAHIWLQSPGNSAFRYMSRAGGKVIKEHPDRWRESSIKDGYECIICGFDCHCVAAEMLLEFND